MRECIQAKSGSSTCMLAFISWCMLTFQGPSCSTQTQRGSFSSALPNVITKLLPIPITVNVVTNVCQLGAHSSVIDVDESRHRLVDVEQHRGARLETLDTGEESDVTNTDSASSLA